MAKLVISNTEEQPEIVNNSTNQPIPIPEKPKTALSVVDEGTPRQCDYLGSFEVKNFTSAEERGNYITQQLYVICKQKFSEHHQSSSKASHNPTKSETSNHSLGNLQSETSETHPENINTSKNSESSNSKSVAENNTNNHKNNTSSSSLLSNQTESSDGGNSSGNSSAVSGSVHSDSHPNKVKSWAVCLVLTIAGIKVCDPSNLKNVLQMFALRRISFSTAIPALNVFAISAREPGSPHNLQYAHVFRTDEAEQINQIVGLAFKQAYTLEKPALSNQNSSPINKIPENLAKIQNNQPVTTNLGYVSANNTPSHSQVSCSIQPNSNPNQPNPSHPSNPTTSTPISHLQGSKSCITASQTPSKKSSFSNTFEKRIFDQILNNNENKAESSSSGLSSGFSSGLGNFNFMKRSKSFKKNSGVVRDASCEFQLGGNVQSVKACQGSPEF